MGQLPGLPEVEFGTEVGGALNEGKNRSAISLEEAVEELRSFHEKVVGDAAADLCVGEVAAAFEVMTVQSKGGSVKFAVVPLSFQRGRHRATTAESTVTVTYKNPDCPPVQVDPLEVGGPVPESVLAVTQLDEGG